MRTVLFFNRNRIAAKRPWSPDGSALMKQVPGANWSETAKAWTFPKTLETIRALKDLFGDSLKPEPAVRAWVLKEHHKDGQLRRMGRRSDATLLRVPEISPVLAEAMKSRTYQRSGARFGALAGSFLLADEPGLGKTAQAIACMMESDAWEGEHLIVAPKTSLHTVWRRQTNLWAPQVEVVVMPEGKAARAKAWQEFEQLDTPKFLIINPAMLRRKYAGYCKKCDIWEGERQPKKHWLEDHKFKRSIKSEDWPEILNNEWGYVVLDESHESLAAYKPSNVTMQTQGLLDLRSQHRMALTGTPLRGSELNLWGTLDWLGHKTGGYWAWVERYFETTEGFFGKTVHGVDPERTKELHKTLDRFVLRRTRAEVRPDLPLGKRQDVLVEMTPRQRKDYESFAEMGEASLSSGSISGQGLLSEMTRLKQFAYGVWKQGVDNLGRPILIPTGESPKTEWMMQWLKERGVTGNPKTEWLPEKGSGFKYVVVSPSTEVLMDVESVLSKAGIKSYRIDGSTSPRNRTLFQQRFQSESDPVRVLMIQTQTGGVSIELDAWCDEMVLLGETFVADDQVQVEGRINNRSGRVAPRTWWYVRTADTIEQSIAERNWSQHDLQHKLLDGRRGVELALHLIRGDA